MRIEEEEHVDNGHVEDEAQEDNMQIEEEEYVDSVHVEDETHEDNMQIEKDVPFDLDNQIEVGSLLNTNHLQSSTSDYLDSFMVSDEQLLQSGDEDGDDRTYNTQSVEEQHTNNHVINSNEDYSGVEEDSIFEEYNMSLNSSSTPYDNNIGNQVTHDNLDNFDTNEFDRVYIYCFFIF